MISKIVGFGFLGIGLIFSVFCRYGCYQLCNNKCVQISLSPCYLLLIFVGIIFIVCGTCIVADKEIGKSVKLLLR